MKASTTRASNAVKMSTEFKFGHLDNIVRYCDLRRNNALLKSTGNTIIIFYKGSQTSTKLSKPVKFLDQIGSLSRVCLFRRSYQGLLDLVD